MSNIPTHILDYLVDTQVQVFAIPKRKIIVEKSRKCGKGLANKIAHAIQNWGKRNNATISGVACLVFIGIMYRALEIYQMIGGVK